MIKEIPMLYSTPMVQSIGLNRKTKTRRTKGLEFINQTPNCWRYDGQNEDPEFHWFEEIRLDDKPAEKYKSIKCPYGKVGDVIYVRETWGEHVGKHEPVDTIVYKADSFCKDFLSKTCTINNGIILSEWFDESLAAETTWKSPLHLKKIHARHWLQITDIKVERLKDVSEEDAIAEGVEPIADGYKNYATLPKIISTLHCWDTARMSFFSLWESINGVGSIELNPWVWVISFKRVNHERQTD